jgi:mRNA-degrading endonuclease RelE of RelBE toxin-antitoxin system
VSQPSFEVAWSPTAQRDLQRLPEKVATAVAEFVYGALADNPHRVGRPLHLQLAGRHAARRGSYRIVYRIDDELRLIRIETVEHRSDVYRRR